MSKRFSIMSVLAALFALCLLLAAPAALAASGGDKDGDHDSDPATSYEDDHTTSDDGDNAHPSGKDRSVENGGSGNQGHSESNPDDSRGPQRYEGGRGDDKSQGPGGTDREDQDGNNGCGNDDDFDDDNNGHCGRPQDTETPPSTGGGGNSNPCPNGDMNGSEPGCGSNGGGSVGGSNEERCPGSDSMVKGKSCSEPDRDGRGPDRNEVDWDKTVDGNNGCGNDADRNDDNEGWCGHKPKPSTPVGSTPNGSTPPVVQGETIHRVCDADASMSGIQPCLRPNLQPTPDVEVLPSTPEDDVLGVRFDRAQPSVEAAGDTAPEVAAAVEAEGAVLPFTGGAVLPFVAAGFALMGAGAAAVRVRQK